MERPLPPPSSPRSLLTTTLLSGAIAVAVAAGCGDKTPPSPEPTGAAPAASASSSGQGAVAPPSNSAGVPDPKRGAELVLEFECARCHDGVARASTIPLPHPPPTDLTPADATKPDNQHCFHCHAAILDGKYKAPKPSTTERWKKNVEHLRDVPTLTGAHQRFRRSWIEAFLTKPHDLRPRLAPTMPRLALTPAQVRDVAAFLVPDAAEKPAPPPSKEAIAEGRELFEKKGCPSCHVIGGAAPFKTGTPPKPGEKGITAAMRLAPDLRHARDRMELDTIVRWVKKPGSIKADTLMPETPMSDDEAQKIAAFLVGETLAPEEPKKVPARLPVLDRRVSYEELKDRIFNKICWHCHSDADYAIGDGGPGNTGGFGFVPRGLNLAAYDGILSGSLDDQGERRSIFEPMADGTPRLVAALAARWTEEAGKEDPAIRGMPLGMPSLSPEEVQIVETWIAQGHSPD